MYAPPLTESELQAQILQGRNDEIKKLKKTIRKLRAELRELNKIITAFKSGRWITAGREYTF